MPHIISDPGTVADLVCGKYARPVQVPIPSLLKPHVFGLAMRRMQDLINDPNRDKWKLGNENDDGLQRKFPTPQNPTADFKWFYHQKQVIFLDLAKRHKLDTSRYEDFIRTNDFITRNAVNAVTPYIEALDEQLPGYAFKRNFLAGNHVLRLIVDDPPSVTKKLEVASAHTDYAFCSLHLWENRPQFQWYNEETKTWEGVVEDQETPSSIFLLGRKATLMTGGKRIVAPNGEQTKEVVPGSGILRPLLHRVREIGNVEELITPRLAVVIFFHVPLVL